MFNYLNKLASGKKRERFFSLGAFAMVLLLTTLVAFLAADWISEFVAGDWISDLDEESHQLDFTQDGVAPARLLQRGSRSARIFGGGGGGDKAMILFRLVTWILTLIIWLVFAFIYKNRVVDKIPIIQSFQGASFGTFKIGYFDCCNDVNLCLHSWCCLSVRAAHTLHIAGLANYWLALFLYSCFCCCTGPICRLQLQQKAGMTTTCGMNIIMWIFCPCCVVGQEAYEVDDVSKANVACCCKLLLTPVSAPGQVYAGTTVVGQVVGTPVEVITAAAPPVAIVDNSVDNNVAGK